MVVTGKANETKTYEVNGNSEESFSEGAVVVVEVVVVDVLATAAAEGK